MITVNPIDSTNFEVKVEAATTTVETAAATVEATATTVETTTATVETTAAAVEAATATVETRVTADGKGHNSFGSGIHLGWCCPLL